MFANIGHTLLLAFGFGFVIFWHELGHFLAAKWADVRVEQFAVGFGQALFSWRKGLGFRWGSTQKDYHARVLEQVEKTQGNTLQFREALAEPTEAQLLAAAAELPISETEYRLNWIPLGGYVKMMGQDDLKPGVVANDPRSYTSKPVGKRMVIVSAGVIMNIILAAIGFTYIFTVGFEVPQPIVGGVLPGSPASETYRLVDNKMVPAPLQVGDRIDELNGKWQSSFETIALNTDLSLPDSPIPLVVTRAATGQTETVYVTPRKAKPDSQFPQMGVEPYRTLKVFPDPDKNDPSEVKKLAEAEALGLPEDFLLQPGDTIITADGKPVSDYRQLFEVQQAGQGSPLKLSVKDESEKIRQVELPSHFAASFAGPSSMTFAGMEMLNRIDTLTKDSPAIGKLKPGDVVTGIADAAPGGNRVAYPTGTQLLDFIRAAGERQSMLRFTVSRDGHDVTAELTPSISIEPHRKGVGIGLGMADGYPVVAGVAKNTPAADAGLVGGAKLTSVDGKPVKNWLDVAATMKTLKANTPFTVTAVVGGESKTYTFKGLPQEQIETIAQTQYTSDALALLMPDTYVRKVAPGHVWTAAAWGVGETRDAVLQVYLTVRSMFKGSISVKEISGPVGILTAGYKVAERGTTRLVWFLAIISANLAVMNFLPIPIVDGGLFTFLIIEKIKGGPISPRVQTAAQIVGLALLLCVFVFATYQDLFRIPFMFHG
jgi:regulator of sigma E protease